MTKLQDKVPLQNLRHGINLFEVHSKRQHSHVVSKNVRTEPSFPFMKVMAQNKRYFESRDFMG